MRKLKKIIMLFAICLTFYKIGEKAGQTAGYELGFEKKKTLARFNLGDIANKDSFERCVNDYQGLVKQINKNKMCENKLALALWLAESRGDKAGGISKTPKTGEDESTEPTQEEGDFDIDVCTNKCIAKHPFFRNRCLSDCMEKDYIAVNCAYEEGSFKKQCEKDAESFGDHYFKAQGLEKEAAQTEKENEELADTIIEKTKDTK